MRRRRVEHALLALLALFLVSGSSWLGVARTGESAGERRPAGDAPFGEDQVRAQLRRVNPGLSDRQLDRIASAVVRSSDRHSLAPELVTAVLLVESGARPWARSPKGALGLMQVMPHVAAQLDFAGNLATIESNVEAGCLILADNIRRLGEEDGISAYFWGSNIRGVSYLRRVRAARADLRRSSAS